MPMFFFETLVVYRERSMAAFYVTVEKLRSVVGKKLVHRNRSFGRSWV